MAAQRVALKNLLDLQGQRRKALPHVGTASRKPPPHAGRQRDHRGRPSTSAATAAVSVAASTAPVIRIRTLATNSISMAPPPAEPTGAGIAPDSGATIAGTKQCCCPTPSLRSAPSDQQRPRHAISPCRRRDLPRRLQALQDYLELLILGPTTTPSRIHHFEPFDLGTALITVHNDSSQ